MKPFLSLLALSFALAFACEAPAQTFPVNNLQVNGSILASAVIVTPSITGVTNAAAAASGAVGQLVCNTTASTGLATGTNTNVNTLTSLPAGVWSLAGTIAFTSTTGTVQNSEVVSVSATSATFGAIGSTTQVNSAGNAGFSNTLSSPTVFVATSAATTYYLVGFDSFSSGSVNTTSQFCALRIR